MRLSFSRTTETPATETNTFRFKLPKHCLNVLAIVGVVTLVATAFWGVITLSKALADRIVSCLKQIDDGRARERIFATSQEEIRLISDNELVSMIFAMLDGPRGDDDKEAILKTLEALDCVRSVSAS